MRKPHSKKYARTWAAEGVGRALREAREAVNVIRQELASTLDVHPGCVQRWEAGRAVPSLATLMRVAWALAIPPSALLEACD